jgi:hypothetical protein
MKPEITTDCTNLGKGTIWFTPMRNSMPELPDDKTEFSLQISMDLVNDVDDEKKEVLVVFFDMQVALENHGEIMCRHRFIYQGDNITFDDIFQVDVLYHNVRLGLMFTFFELEKKCNAIGIPFRFKTADFMEMDVDRPENIIKLTEGIIGSYHQFERQYYYNNLQVRSIHALAIKSDLAGYWLIYGTFTILDYLLFKKSGFNLARNRESFDQYIPLRILLTVRDKCFQIKDKNLHLTIFEAFILLKCINCALQVLVGSDKADLLIRKIELKNMRKRNRDQYIQLASNFIRTADEAGFWDRFEHLKEEEEVDWFDVIR